MNSLEKINAVRHVSHNPNIAICPSLQKELGIDRIPVSIEEAEAMVVPLLTLGDIIGKRISFIVNYAHDCLFDGNSKAWEKWCEEKFGFKRRQSYTRNSASIAIKALWDFVDDVQKERLLSCEDRKLEALAKILPHTAAKFLKLHDITKIPRDEFFDILDTWVKKHNLGDLHPETIEQIEKEKEKKELAKKEMQEKKAMTSKIRGAVKVSGMMTDEQLRETVTNANRCDFFTTGTRLIDVAIDTKAKIPEEEIRALLSGMKKTFQNLLELAQKNGVNVHEME